MSEILPVVGCAINNLLPEGPVVRMNSFQHSFHRKLRCWFEVEYPKCLLGPVNFPGRGDPTEAAAATQALRFGQEGFAAPQCILGPPALGSLFGLTQGSLHCRHN